MKAYDKDTKIILSLSKSPSNFGTRFHNYLYNELDLNYFYKSEYAEDFETAYQALKALNIYGCSISMPFKQKAFEASDQQDPTANKAKAANTLIFSNDGCKSYNTDLSALEKVLGDLTPQSVLILGSGAIAEMCNSYFSDLDVYIYSRNTEAKSRLDQKYSNATELTDKFDLIINATPLMIKDRLDTDIAALFKSAQMVLDYPVDFNYASHDNIVSGMEITKWQAREQFRLYTGVEISDDQFDRAIQFVLDKVK